MIKSTPSASCKHLVLHPVFWPFQDCSVLYDYYMSLNAVPSVQSLWMGTEAGMSSPQPWIEDTWCRQRMLSTQTKSGLNVYLHSITCCVLYCLFLMRNIRHSYLSTLSMTRCRGWGAILCIRHACCFAYLHLHAMTRIVRWAKNNSRQDMYLGRAGSKWCLPLC